jgi:hypothetical protein
MAPQSGSQIPDGEVTAVVYRLIRDARYADAVQLLGAELQHSPRSRAGLSLLGYCYYRLQEFALAAECYAPRARAVPPVPGPGALQGLPLSRGHAGRLPPPGQPRLPQPGPPPAGSHQVQ